MSEIVYIGTRTSFIWIALLRLFFAVDIESQAKQEIDAWRETNIKSLPNADSFKAVPLNNFHITLSFLGTVDQQQKQAMLKAAQRLSEQLNVATQAHSISLDKLGLFKQPKVLYLGLSTIPNWMSLLAQKLQSEALLQNIFQEKRPYRPHVTLYRKVSLLPDVNVQPILLKCTSFSLYLSENSGSGVQYSPIYTWQV